MSAQDARDQCISIITKYGEEKDGKIILKSGEVKGFNFTYRYEEGSKKPITRLLPDDDKWVFCRPLVVIGILTAWLHATGKYHSFRKEKEPFRKEKEPSRKEKEPSRKEKEPPSEELALLKECNQLQKERIAQLEKELAYLKDGVAFWEKHSKDCDHCKSCSDLHA